MISKDLRTLCLVLLVPSLFVVRHTMGHLEPGPKGLAVTVFLLLLGAVPAGARLVRHVLVRRAPNEGADDSAQPESSGFGTMRSGLADLLCLVLALAVWAELRSPEPLQRVQPLRSDKRCVIAPC